MDSYESALAMVLERFGEPLVPRSYPIPDLEPGALLVQVTAAGICGSDLDITAGRDPRIRLPLIPGHEGVGRVLALGGDKADMFGNPLQPGDRIVWHRGITCGRCYYCAVRRQASLCLHRQVYGISLPCAEPPYLNGCYTQVLYVRPESEIIRLPEQADDAALVAATCSGATAAHGIELADVQMGDTVVVLGPGPLGIYTAAFAMERGATQVLMLGTRRGVERMKLAASFGCITINADEISLDQRREMVMDMTHGLGADVVFDAAGNPRSVAEAMELAARGGTVALPGVAVPQGSTPVSMYEQVAVKNLRLQGVWVSDARHMYQAVQLTLSDRYPFEQMVTHRFPLQQANEALETLRRREGMKIVLQPQEEG
ncbi:MAG: alcohol dehydrogenase catalytic domain-containing protein [candidate division WS1 bacterium]|nr:alcohol dehydrogenase catalytic domain-containing protein [candidate division WS1 bacterium]